MASETQSLENDIGSLGRLEEIINVEALETTLKTIHQLIDISADQNQVC